MAVSKENNLVSLYVELNKFAQAADYERAVKSAGKILQVAPEEEKAFRSKIVCLIQLSNFKEALNLLCNPKNSTFAGKLLFEKAYVQYRLNLTKDALQTVESISELTPALKELKAQILYRLENYQECYNLYRDIIKNTSDDYEDERQTNMAAAIANLAAVDPNADLPQLEERTYELCYNAGCAAALRGKSADALALLKRAELACAESVTEDGGTEEDVSEEVAIIRVQQAYCLQNLGREKEAAALYHDVLKNKPSDHALIAIAGNNLVVVNRETNVFDSRKRMKAATQDGLENKLNSRQRRAIAFNQAILAIYSNQPEFCKQCCVKLAKEFGCEEDAALVEATSLARDGRAAQALALLNKYGDKFVLASVQLLLQQGDRKAAIEALEGSNYRYQPGVIGALVTLYSAENNNAGVSRVLTEAMEYYKNDKESWWRLAGMWRRAARALSSAGDAASATRCLELLSGAAPHDAKALARLVRALAPCDAVRARKFAAALPPLDDLEDKVDIEMLETSNWMMGAKMVKKSNQTKQEQSPGTPAAELRKMKRSQRKRKSKLPPNADLSRPPDPERWLPKYERSAYRKRRGGNRREVIKGSQGMTTAATDQYDMSKQQPSSGSQAKSPMVTEKTSSSEAAWQRKQQQKKKKRKGGKW